MQDARVPAATNVGVGGAVPRRLLRSPTAGLAALTPTTHVLLARPGSIDTTEDIRLHVHLGTEFLVPLDIATVVPGTTDPRLCDGLHHVGPGAEDDPVTAPARVRAVLPPMMTALLRAERTLHIPRNVPVRPQASVQLSC